VQATQQATAVAGSEMAAVGINVDFAPVSDVIPPDGASDMLGRSFGSDPNRVERPPIDQSSGLSYGESRTSTTAFDVSKKCCTRTVKMLSRTAAALAALLVFGQSALAASNNRITHHGRAVRHAPPPAAFALPDATPSHAVKPFTAEEKGWFDRASRVF
jgi:hypothetical protein